MLVCQVQGANVHGVTIRDVAQAAGVSVATASRVLSGHPSTSVRSRDKVHGAAASLGFTANAQARALRTTHTNTVGVLISDIRNPFFAEITHQIEKTLHPQGIVTLLCNADESTSQQDLSLRLLLSRRVDGIIVAPQGDGSGSLREVLLSGVPTVFVDRTIPDTDVPAITSDNESGIREAVWHLKDKGHRRVAYIAGPQETSTGRERLAAFTAAVTDAELETDPDWIVIGDFKYDSGVAGTRQLLKLRDRPTALICADTLMTMGAIEECGTQGISVGQELSVIGYDDNHQARLHRPALSVIAHDPGEMGRLAASAMKSLLDGDTPESVVLPSQLIMRQSVSRPAQADSREVSKVSLR